MVSNINRDYRFSSAKAAPELSKGYDEALKKPAAAKNPPQKETISAEEKTN
jgi:hypothetical protein